MASGVSVQGFPLVPEAKQATSLTFSFDGRDVWVFRVPQDTSRWEESGLIPWPPDLRRHLRGRSEVELRETESGTVLDRREAVFGDLDEDPQLAEQRVRIADQHGRLLIVDKSERLVSTFEHLTPERRVAFLDSTRQMMADLREIGVESFLAYGSLLGVIREQGLIPHDADADLGYVSSWQDPVDVIRESFEIERKLKARGYEIERYSGGAFKVEVDEGGGATRGIDLFAGYFTGDTLHLLGEITTPYRREWLLPTHEIEVNGVSLAVPADPERLLVETYGPHWRTPDPSFVFAHPPSIHRRFNAQFRGLRDRLDLWERAHGAARVATLPPMGSSQFHRWALQGTEEIDHAVELSCGRGQGAHWMAADLGKRVHATEVLPRAYAAVEDLAREEDLDLTFSELNLLDYRQVLASLAGICQEPVPRVVVARHVLDSVNKVGKENMLRMARALTRHGGFLRTQFIRAREEVPWAERPAVSTGLERPLVLPVPEDALDQLLTRTGGRVTQQIVLPVPEQTVGHWRLPGDASDYEFVRLEIRFD